ncbi:substrate-binding domain-containing protein [Parendozoicomonas sp. Alg238-R29]|uniref:substrate-binding domain-containing protein n=1 Tax=Parendozoicomonas sp. Alg238-R29 TaxID=2993446 RepID=UPI00248D5075|nr:substrate-binding domain-containing protein [Parendozoicomonas sp. Alg238-R29]
MQGEEIGRKGGYRQVPVIGMVLHGLDGFIYQQLEKEAKLYCEERVASGASRCRVISGGSLDNRDIAAQKQWFKQLMVQKVDGLIVAPVGTRALIPQLIEAKKKGVSVVNIDSRLDPELLSRNRLIIPRVGPDNTSAARNLASYLAQKVGKGGKVAILSGSPGELASFERVVAAKSVLGGAGIKVVAVKSAEWDALKAQDVTMALLDKFRDLDGIFAANDAMALGAMRAADLKNIPLSITGFDGDPQLLNYVRTGRILATVDWYPGQQGIYAIEKIFDRTSSDRKTPWRLLVQSDLVD